MSPFQDLPDNQRTSPVYLTTASSCEISKVSTYFQEHTDYKALGH